jgi:hypothetical protein
MPDHPARLRRSAVLSGLAICVVLASLFPNVASAILNGADADREPAVSRSIVAVVIEDSASPGPDGRPGFYPSTGIVVARQWILTVKHAFINRAAAQYAWQVHFDKEIRVGATGSRIRSLRRSDAIPHPNLDLALLHIDQPMPFEYRPTRVVADWRNLESRSELRGLLAGWGPTQKPGGGNRLHYVEEPISAPRLAESAHWPDLVPRGQGDDFMEIDQRDGRGSCSGDSGGPVLARLADGDLGLLGIITGNASYQGEHPCLAYSYAIRADRVIDWIARVTGTIFNPRTMLFTE